MQTREVNLRTRPQWRSQRGRMRMAKFHPIPLPYPWEPFSIRTIKYCNLSLSKFDENKPFTFLKGPYRTCRAQFYASGAHSRLNSPFTRSEMGPPKFKWAKTTILHFWEGSTRPESSSWLISPRRQSSGCPTARPPRKYALRQKGTKKTTNSHGPKMT